MKQIYVVEYSSANYAGAGSRCLVLAHSKEHALENTNVINHAEDEYREQDEDQVIEDGGDEEGPFASIDSAEFLLGSDYEEYVRDKLQCEAFYPAVNFSYENFPEIFTWTKNDKSNN